MALSTKFALSASVREVARFLVAKIPQKDLEAYAAASSMFASGGFRKGNVAAVRSRIIQKIGGSELIDASLRRLLAEHDEGCAVISKLSDGVVSGNVRAFEFFFGYAQFQFSALLDGRFEELRFTQCPESGEYPEISESDQAWAVSTLSSLLWPLSAFLSFEGTAAQSQGAGAQSRGAGAQSLGAGAQSLGAGAQSLGAGAQSQGAGAQSRGAGACSRGAGASSPALAPASSSFAVQKRFHELQEEVSRLKGVETRLEKEQKRRAAAEDAAAKALSRAETAEGERGGWRQRAERAEAELLRNKGDAEAQSAAIVETRLAQGFASWLGPARAARIAEAAAQLASSAGSGASSAGRGAFSAGSGAGISGSGAVAPRVLDRAAAALAAQAKADSVAGVRHLLEAQLEACEAARVRSRALLADALDPLPALVEVEKELAAEIARLGKLLGKGRAPAADPEEALSLAINTASDSQLPDLLHTIGKLKELQVLTPEAACSLEEAVRRRYAVCYAKRGGPGLQKGDKVRPADILRCALRGEVPAVLLIDAHNTLYALQSRYSRPQDHRGPCAEAREWLVGDIVQMVSNAPNCRVIIVFDGPERTESTPSGNVKVIYSGGAKDREHRADDVIVDEARFLTKADPSCNFLLATNDGGLVGRATTLGVRNISPIELLSYLK